MATVITRIVGDRLERVENAEMPAAPVGRVAEAAVPSVRHALLARLYQARPDLIPFATDFEAMTDPALALVVRAAERHQEAKPPGIAIATPQGPLRIHRADHYRRLPAYEALAAMEHLPVGEVWSLVHEGAGLRAATAPVLVGGHYRIWLNVRARCPLHRLGSFFHEAQHIRNRDCFRPLQDEADYRTREAACHQASTSAVQEWAGVVRVRRPGLPLDAARCTRCFDGAETPCPQGSAVFEAVTSALAPL